MITINQYDIARCIEKHDTKAKLKRESMHHCDKLMRVTLGKYRYVNSDMICSLNTTKETIKTFLVVWK